MSLVLDKRHRAMLREMGVRVWQPAPDVVPAIDSGAGGASTARAAADFVHETKPVAPAAASPAREAIPARTAPARAPVAPAAAAPQAPAREAAATGTWSMGEAQALYADVAHGEGSRWLVLAETPAAALQRGPFNPFEGEAGKLLDNMLRAARLNKAGVVLLAPLARGAAAGAGTGTGLPEALPALVAAARPDVVLVMGRLAAQALLQSSEPFGKLRGQVHGLHGAKTVLTYDATYLLRNAADKAKAWDDLCLAMSLVTTPGSA
ncbi:MULTISPECIES: uracil-DNA glycosylase family protein [unclassified Polaromonas]|uniref:uracil-DNA glycosylase family protein n=1 Tax=unclassified Polaromonas TaxID=2638319 RepID=UPI000F08D6C2|nr:MULTISPECIES: uracil-DNA glycosylase family protein [unclassified Polaromonas]AYQ27988.1 uracil-DNA glycosylase [Polaromonas sp. SP1]QGJ17153.1 uracil-DNA glycosylase [Polaromonas sp. Pch-P]